MADVAVGFGEEVLLGEGYCYGDAEAGACYAFFVQLGDIVVVGIAGKLGHCVVTTNEWS